MPKTVKPAGRGASAPNKPAGKRNSKKVAKKKVAAGPKSSRKYIRNLHGGAGGARLGLADGSELQLAPRGQVGDLLLVGEDQISDPLYQRNKDVLFEELSVEDGLEVIDKQNINAQTTRPSSPLDSITNEYGKAYQKPVVVTPPYESQGQVVGEITPAQSGQSSLQTGNIQRQVEATMTQMGQPPTVNDVMGPAQISVPGSQFNPDVMPAGITMQQAEQFLQTPREQRQALVEQWANQQIENLVNQLRG